MNYKEQNIDGIKLTAEQVKEVVENATNKKEFIKDRQDYWFLDSCGIVKAKEYNSSAWNMEHLVRNNIYLTEAEAQKADDKRLALGTIMQYIRDNDLEFVPNWEDDNEYKYQISGWSYEVDRPINDLYSVVNTSPHDLVFKSKKDCEKVFDNCKDEIKTLLT